VKRSSMAGAGHAPTTSRVDEYGCGDADTASAGQAARKKRPAGLHINTDFGSADSGDSAHRASGSWSVWGLTSTACNLLATPKNFCINSARRVLTTAPCEDDGERKLWMRLELRLGLQTLVAGVGNGRLGWLIQALRCDVARTLGLEPALVDVREVYEAKEGCLTVVECIVSVPAPHGRLSLATAASDLMDQCERNRARVDDADDLMKLVSHVDVKGHGSSRQQWSFPQVVLVAAIVAAMAHYYGALAFGAGAPALGLRGGVASTTSSMGRRPTAAPRTALSQPTSLQQVQTPRTRRLQGGSALQLHMLDPMTISALALGFADLSLGKRPTRKAQSMARRACQHADKTRHTFTSDPVLGTRTVVRSLATQALLSADEDERPVHRTLIDDASEQVFFSFFL